MSKLLNAATALAFCFTCVAGCGGDGGAVPVSGVITLDGQPMPNVAVTFDRPELPPNENIGWIGRTDAQGRYELRPSMGEGSGVPPGQYRVSFTTAVADPNAPATTTSRSPTTPFVAAEPPPPPERIPPRHRTKYFVVSEEGTNAANF